MKKLIILTALLFSIFNGRAQTVSDCNSAQNICSNPDFLFQGISGTGLPTGLGVSNPSVNPQNGNGLNASSAPNSGCLLSNGPGPQWLLITVSASGNLGFSFGSSGSANPQIGFYDWAMWLYSPTTCTNIFSNTQAPVSCNWNATNSGGTGMGIPPTGADSSNFQPSIPVTVGQQYLILISNYSGVNTPVSFTNTGTAGLSCGFNSQICVGNSVTVSPIGFLPLANQTFTLMPSGLTNGTGTFVVTPAATQIYTVQGTGVNSQSVQVVQTSTTMVTVNPQPSVAPTTTQTSCTSTVNAINLGLTFNPPNPVPSYSVAWTPVPVGPPNYSQTVVSGGILPGTYTAVVTSVGGCTASSVVTISPIPAPSVFSLSPPGSVYSVTCAQPTVMLMGTAANYNYNWSNGIVAPMSGDTTYYPSTHIGNWTVTGTNVASGCISSHTFTVYLNNTPPTSAVTPTSQNITCAVGAVVTATGTALTPTSNAVLMWYSPALPNNPVIFYSQTSVFAPTIFGNNGTNTFVVMNPINGCTTTKTIEVVNTSGTYPTFTLSSTQNFSIGCTTKSLTTVQIDGAQVGMGGAATSTLLPPGYTGNAYGTSSTVLVYTVNVPGNYTVVVQANGTFCETRVPVSIVQNTFAPPVTAGAPTQILDCKTTSVVLQGNSPNFVSYNWAFQGTPGNTPTFSVAVLTNTAAPTNSIVNNYTLTVRDSNNACTSRTIVTMYQNLYPPKALIGQGSTALTCASNSISLLNGSQSTIPAGFFTKFQPVIGYVWTGPTPQLPDSFATTYIAYTPGTYTMVAEDMNNFCTSAVTTTIGDSRVYPTIITTTSVPLDCDASTSGGVKLIASAQGLTPGQVTAQWLTPQPPPNILGAGTLTLTTDGVGFYKLSVTTNSNGCSRSTTVRVTNGSLTANFTPDKETGFAPLTVNFSNTSASSSTAMASSSITSVWSFGNGTTRTTTTNVSTSAVYSAPGTYTVTMFSSKGACRDTVVKTIFVDIPSKLIVPNVFTPNGDNSNDIFFVQSANLTQISIQIFDRWGNKIYDLNSSTGNIAWDGKNQSGHEAPDGTYFYTIKATGKDGTSYDTKGTVSLYR